MSAWSKIGRGVIAAVLLAGLSAGCQPSPLADSASPLPGPVVESGESVSDSTDVPEPVVSEPEPPTLPGLPVDLRTLPTVTPTGSLVATAVALADGCIVTTHRSPSRVVCTDPSSAEPRWTVELDGVVDQLAADGSLVLLRSAGRLTALLAADGTEAWQSSAPQRDLMPLRAAEHHAHAFASGVALITAHERTRDERRVREQQLDLIWYDRDSGEELWVWPCGASCLVVSAGDSDVLVLSDGQLVRLAHAQPRDEAASEGTGGIALVSPPFEMSRVRLPAGLRDVLSSDAVLVDGESLELHRADGSLGVSFDADVRRIWWTGDFQFVVAELSDSAQLTAVHRLAAPIAVAPSATWLAPGDWRGLSETGTCAIDSTTIRCTLPVLNADITVLATTAVTLDAVTSNTARSNTERSNTERSNTEGSNTEQSNTAPWITVVIPGRSIGHVQEVEVWRTIPPNLPSDRSARRPGIGSADVDLVYVSWGDPRVVTESVRGDFDVAREIAEWPVFEGASWLLSDGGRQAWRTRLAPGASDVILARWDEGLSVPTPNVAATFAELGEWIVGAADPTLDARVLGALAHATATPTLPPRCEDLALIAAAAPMARGVEAIADHMQFAVLKWLHAVDPQTWQAMRHGVMPDPADCDDSSGLSDPASVASLLRAARSLTQGLELQGANNNLLRGWSIPPSLLLEADRDDAECAAEGSFETSALAAAAEFHFAFDARPVIPVLGLGPHADPQVMNEDPPSDRCAVVSTLWGDAVLRSGDGPFRMVLVQAVPSPLADGVTNSENTLRPGSQPVADFEVELGTRSRGLSYVVQTSMGAGPEGGTAVRTISIERYDR